MYPTDPGMQRPGSAPTRAACARQPVQCPDTSSAGASSAMSATVDSMRSAQSDVERCSPARARDAAGCSQLVALHVHARLAVPWVLAWLRQTLVPGPASRPPARLPSRLLLLNPSPITA